jgi:tRNA A-37 threonylcarbamoyl transferase component Bud32
MSTELRAETLNCPQCGASGEALLANGLCAHCLLGAALDIDDKGAGDAPREVGRYRIDGEIAHGGVGIVYRAWQADLQRTVALKMLLPARLDAKDARDRFRREAELMASLDHPGILPVYEVGVQDSLPYFSMKLAENGNLAQRIAALRGQFRECARLVAQVARAIAHAHARGVLHRDLKPSNIVFDAADQPLVTDFGLARLLAKDSTLTGIDAVIGTPRYVAPEAITTTGARLTAAADVYGLGAILYELLSGSAPFAELTPLQILQQIATRRPRPPRQFDAAIPAPLEAICLRCLEKRPEDRYPSANALADALENWLAGTRRTFIDRLRTKLGVPSRRRRFGIAAILIVAGAVAAAGAYFFLREPIPIPDPATATRTIAVLPFDVPKAAPAATAAARQLAAHLRLPSEIHMLPFEATLSMAASKNFPDNAIDSSTTLGAFIRVDIVALPGAKQYAVSAVDILRDQILFRATFALSEVENVAGNLAEALTKKRQQLLPEARLPRGQFALLLHGIRLVRNPTSEGNATAIATLKNLIDKAPDLALAHAWLADAYIEHYVEPIWLDSAIEEAARAQRMDPTLGLAPMMMGVAYYNRSWISRAALAYEQARQLDSRVGGALALVYGTQGRYVDEYRELRDGLRFAPGERDSQRYLVSLLLMIGELDAGERAMRIMIEREPEANLRGLFEAEIALVRGDSAHCREVASRLEPDFFDGFYTSSGLVRSCAIQQGDFEGALATMAATMNNYAKSNGTKTGNNPALRKAILLAQVNRRDEIPALLKDARQSMQAAIDSGNEYPGTWLRMAGAQRLAGEIDAAYATLEHAFALGLTVNYRNRSDVEFLPFLGDERFQAMHAKSEAYVAEQRRQIAQLLAADPPEYDVVAQVK